MHDLNHRVKESFDCVHAEASLKASTEAFVAAQMKKRQKTPFFLGLRKAAAVACMAMLFFAGYGTRAWFETDCVVSIDINPSVELGINAFDRVVSAEAYNAGGEQLLAELDLRFLPCEDAVERIAASEEVVYLLSQEEELTITIVGEDEESNASLCARLSANTGSGAKVYFYSTAPREVSQAHACGFSYGKYLAYLHALRENADLKPEDVRHMTMKEIRALCGGDHGHHGAEATEGIEETTLPTEETIEPTTGSHGMHDKKGHKGKHHD